MLYCCSYNILELELSFHASRDTTITLSEIAQRPSQLNLEKLAQNTESSSFIGYNNDMSFSFLFQEGKWFLKSCRTDWLLLVAIEKDICKIFASLCKSIVPWILPSHLILKGGLNASDVREKLFRLFHKSKSTWVPFGLDANFTRLRLSYTIKVEFVKGSTYENVLHSLGNLF